LKSFEEDHTSFRTGYSDIIIIHSTNKGSIERKRGERKREREG
jgi:hypothetical protein